MLIRNFTLKSRASQSQKQHTQFSVTFQEFNSQKITHFTLQHLTKHVSDCKVAHEELQLYVKDRLQDSVRLSTVWEFDTDCIPEKCQHISAETADQILAMQALIYKLRNLVDVFWDKCDTLNKTLWQLSRKEGADSEGLLSLKLDFATFYNDIRSDIYKLYGELDVRAKKIRAIIRLVNTISFNNRPFKGGKFVKKQLELSNSPDNRILQSGGAKHATTIERKGRYVWKSQEEQQLNLTKRKRTDLAQLREIMKNRQPPVQLNVYCN